MWAGEARVRNMFKWMAGSSTKQVLPDAGNLLSAAGLAALSLTGHGSDDYFACAGRKAAEERSHGAGRDVRVSVGAYGEL